MAQPRVRVGLPTVGVLPYVTAGLALATGRLEVESPPADGHQVHVGLTAGAGVEVALADATSLKLEYLYVGLPPVSYWQGVAKTTITYTLGLCEPV